MIGFIILIIWLVVAVGVSLIGYRADSLPIMGIGAAMLCVVAMVDKVNW